MRFDLPNALVGQGTTRRFAAPAEVPTTARPEEMDRTLPALAVANDATSSERTLNMSG